MQRKTTRRLYHRGWIAVATAVVGAAVAGGVGASVLRTQATITGTPTTLTVLTENVARSTGSVTFVTLRSTSITVPEGESHLVLVRLSGSANCTDPNAVSDAVLPPRCAVRVRIGGGTASPGFTEFVGRGSMHAAGARGPLGPGTYAVSVQWAIYTGGGRFAMPNGNLIEIEQIRA